MSTIEASGEARDGVIPTFYVDAVQISGQAFTIQMILGAVDMGGRITPSVHLTLSPAFAAHLAELITSALERKGP
jgi:hypothetical protein